LASKHIRDIAEEVDIIEVGTILCVGEGVRAVRDLKALYPHKIVLADAKMRETGFGYPAQPATLVTETSYQLPLKQPPQWRFQLNSDHHGGS
jgi:hypothetical protein